MALKKISYEFTNSISHSANEKGDHEVSSTAGLSK